MLNPKIHIRKHENGENMHFPSPYISKFEDPRQAKTQSCKERTVFNCGGIRTLPSGRNSNSSEDPAPRRKFPHFAIVFLALGRTFYARSCAMLCLRGASLTWQRNLKTPILPGHCL